MNINSQQSLLISQPLPQAWAARLRSVMPRLRPSLQVMEPGRSRTVSRISAKCPSVVLVKLSTYPGRCEAIALLRTDPVFLVGPSRVQLLHGGQSHEESIGSAP